MARIFIAVTNETELLQKGWLLRSELARRGHEVWITMGTDVLHEWLTTCSTPGVLQFAQPEVIIILSQSPHTWFNAVSSTLQNRRLTFLVLTDDTLNTLQTPWVLPLGTDLETTATVAEKILTTPSP